MVSDLLAKNNIGSVCVCVELGTKEMGIAEDSLKLKNQKTKNKDWGLV